MEFTGKPGYTASKPRKVGEDNNLKAEFSVPSGMYRNGATLKFASSL